MTQFRKWHPAYMLVFVLLMSPAWAGEKQQDCCKKEAAVKKATCAECCAECQTAQTSGKLVTRIHALDKLFAETSLFGFDLDVSLVGGIPVVRQAKAETPQDVLIRVITNNVAPQTWSCMGGRGTIDYFPLGKALVVSQTPEVQQQVEELLAGLRRNKEQATAQTPMPLPTKFMPTVTFGDGDLQCPYGPCMPPQTCLPTFFDTFNVDPVATPLPAEVVAQPKSAIQQCFVPYGFAEASSMPCQSWSVQSVCTDGKRCMQIRLGDGGMATCESVELKLPSVGAVRLHAVKGRLELTGCCFHVLADSIQGMGLSSWVLNGHVEMECKMDDLQTCVRTSQVAFSFKDGHLEVKPCGSCKQPAGDILRTMWLKIAD